MKRIVLLALPLLLSAFVGRESAADGFYVPVGWQQPTYRFAGNPLSDDGIALGRALFYDATLSKNGAISCASCHSSFTAFAHVDHKLSHGIDDKIGTRNAPALQNLAWQTAFMWDGAAHTLDAQALAPIENPLEMNETLENVVAKLNLSARYKAAFFRAYGDSTATGTRTLKALSQFMLTLVSADSKYDKVKRAENGISFTESEQNGYALFRKNCASCHSEPTFSSGRFENNGLAPDSVLNDVGRLKISKDPKDAYRFKVPSLRNVEVTYPYMHDGRFANLQMVLFHYTEGIHASKTLSRELRNRIEFDEQQKRDVINFLKTLTDEKFLRNKKHEYPKSFFAK